MSKIIEQWVEIKNYEGLYEVSNFGRVKSLPGKIRFRRVETSEHILKPRFDGKKYEYVSLFPQTKQKNFKIHRLIANAFIKNPENKPEVNHKDGNKSNNNVENLEWSTRLENVRHGIKTGLSNPWCNKKLTQKQVNFIRSSSLYQRELAKMFNVSRPAISLVKNYKTWNANN